jgi:hypothetical protein
MEGEGEVVDLFQTMRRFTIHSFVTNFNSLRSDPLFQRNFAWAD